MYVSISTLVEDLHTTVTGVQSAITLYTLVMAAFMIAGAKVAISLAANEPSLLDCQFTPWGHLSPASRLT
jgi:hypothetical protein